jgi:uncharacterized protein YwqG
MSNDGYTVGQMHREELYANLKRFGLERIADKVVSLAQTCVRFRTVPKDDADIPVGSSKLGGCPDIPKRREWPLWHEEALAFLGQIDLAEISGYSCCKAFPSFGRLYFFYDVEQSTWGFDPSDKGSWRVIYSSAPCADLVRRAQPPEIPEHALYRSCVPSFYQTLSIPGYESIFISQLDLTAKELHLYADFLESFSATQAQSDSAHQILGFPEEIQGEMQLQCQLVSNGLYCGNERGYKTALARKLEWGAVFWRLLLQLDSDENVGMMWGDLGKLYFWILDEDLGNLNFDNVWMILQCT